MRFFHCIPPIPRTKENTWCSLLQQCFLPSYTANQNRLVPKPQNGRCSEKRFLEPHLDLLKAKCELNQPASPALIIHPQEMSLARAATSPFSSSSSSSSSSMRILVTSAEATCSGCAAVLPRTRRLGRG